MENTAENTMESAGETLIVSRKRKWKPSSVNVPEAGSTSNASTRELTENDSVHMSAPTSRRSAVTTTKLIARIWGEYLECGARAVSPSKTENRKPKKGKKIGEGKWTPYYQSPRKRGGGRRRREVSWIVTSDGRALYNSVSINGVVISPGSVVLVKQSRRGRDSCICLVEYISVGPDEPKVVHGRIMLGAFETVLGHKADKRELCLTSDCLEFDPSDVIQPLDVKIQPRPWGPWGQRSKEHDKMEEKKYFCRNMYCPEKGGFFSLRTETLGLGNGQCHSCKERKAQDEEYSFSICESGKSFTYRGVHYNNHDFLYVSPLCHMKRDETVGQDYKDESPKAYIICQLLGVDASGSPAESSPGSVKLLVRRFYRPEDVNTMDAYVADIHAVYCSEDVETVPVTSVQGKCEVRRKEEFEFKEFPYIQEDTFFCEYVVNNDHKQRQKIDPLILSKRYVNLGDGSGKTTEKSESADSTCKVPRKPLATLDLFSGCGGLSEGLEKSGASVTKWAVEFDQMAAEAFKLNHPDAYTVVQDCNVVLRDIMVANGDANDCIPSTEASSLGSKLDKETLSNLPKPGEVDLIIAGPPCQGFSVLNRYKKTSMSDDKRTMILSLLSYVDYFRPKYMLMENVRNLVCYDNMQPFQLTLKSLIEMGYQVRFGVLEAGFYGVAQSRRRVFIWAASPEEKLPEWPQPMHAFRTPHLRIKLDLEGKWHYSAVSSTQHGAPLRALTVRDTIGDLPALTNGDTTTTMQYKDDPVSWFQKRIRGNLDVLTDHVAKQLSEINLLHCQYLNGGQDWRDLPQKKVQLSNGKFVDLKPQWLFRFLERGTQSSGVLGRLDWGKHFPTAITNPQPRGKVGRWFHPVQHRMISIREYARSQGFPDWYKFLGSIKNKYQQVGNAVPPPLAFALGRKLKEAMEADAS